MARPAALSESLRRGTKRLRRVLAMNCLQAPSKPGHLPPKPSLEAPIPRQSQRPNAAVLPNSWSSLRCVRFDECRLSQGAEVRSTARGRSAHLAPLDAIAPDG